jgi:hypothetical protein
MYVNIITPCTRPENLIHIYRSLDFNFIKKWYICYDIAKLKQTTKLFLFHKKIKEIDVDGTSVNSMWGNQQRNAGLDCIQSGYVYFLDDDNILHPDFFTKINFTVPNKIFLFDQIKKFRCTPIWREFVVRKMDMAQFCVDINLVGKIRFAVGHHVTEQAMHNADGSFINHVLRNNYGKHEYIPEILAYYNVLRHKDTKSLEYRQSQNHLNSIIQQNSNYLKRLATIS